MALTPMGQEPNDKLVMGRGANDKSCRALSLTLDSVLADTPQIPFAGMQTGVVYIPAGSSITTLTFHAAEFMGGTYLPLYDEAGTATTQTVAAGKAYKLNPDIYGAIAIKIVANADGAVFLTLSD